MGIAKWDPEFLETATYQTRVKRFRMAVHKADVDNARNLGFPQIRGSIN